MPPLDVDTRAKEIATSLDAGKLDDATSALREEAGKTDGAEFKKLVQTIQGLDKKGTGADLVFDKDIYGTVVKLQMKNESDIFERSVAIYSEDKNKVSTIWEPFPRERDRYLGVCVKDVTDKMDSGDFQGASQAVNALLKFDKSLGYGVLLNAIREMEKTEKKGQGCDLSISEVRSNIKTEHGAVVSYQLDGYRVSLSHKVNGDSLIREIAVLDHYSAKPIWKPPVVATEKQK